MAILGPSQMPSIFRKQDTDPLKLHAVNQLGGPSVAVEVTESQWEESIRTAMDFISQYFPLESKIAYFYTQPTVIEYDIPEDAYWVVRVSWDPVTTRIDNVFGAESFLFCFDDDIKVVCDDGLLPVKDVGNLKLITPFGRRKLIKKHHHRKQQLIELTYDDGLIRCTPNHPIKCAEGDLINGWLTANECKPGMQLLMMDGPTKLRKTKWIERQSTTAINVLGAKCFFGCHDGKPILVH